MDMYRAEKVVFRYSGELMTRLPKKYGMDVLTFCGEARLAGYVKSVAVAGGDV